MLAHVHTVVIIGFVRFGELHSVQVLRDKVTGLCRGYGFVKFKTAAAADQALQQKATFELKVS